MLKKALTLLLIAIIVLAAFYAIAFIFGKGHVSTAQGSTGPSHPSKAWIKKGQIQYVTTTLSQVQIATRNTREQCATRSAYKKYHAPLGTMFWIRITKTWCFNKKKYRVVSSLPPTIQHAVTTAGALMQWQDEGIDNQPNGFLDYYGHHNGSHSSAVHVRFTRCFPSPFGCVGVDSSSMWARVIGHYDGSSSIK
jgi:uncharacterized protein (UPF0333 family)